MPPRRSKLGVHALAFAVLYRTDRPAAKSASCSGQLRSLLLICGGDGICGLSWKLHYRRLFSTRSVRKTPIRFEQLACDRAHRTINITRRVLISPEETYRLRSSWLTGDLKRIHFGATGCCRRKKDLPHFPSTAKHEILSKA